LFESDPMMFILIRGLQPSW